MKEEFLHYIWRTKSFALSNLKSTDGEKIHPQYFGDYNTNAGPDFLNAKIKIGDTLWAGSVEIHIRSSDWYRHKHEINPAYDNVILHVVYDDDEDICRHFDQKIVCLELKNRIPKEVFENYTRLISNENWVACEQHIHKTNPITKGLLLDRVLVERLEQKTKNIALLLKGNTGDWESTFYQVLAIGLGSKVNAPAFENLSRITPLKVLEKHKNNLFQIEALLFGQAGMLAGKKFEEDYPRKLQKEYAHLQKLYSLNPMAEVNWNFMRMRPANFPTIRIAQLAKLLYQTHHLFSKTLAVKNLEEIENMLRVKLSNYWDNHYRFNKASITRKKSIGKNMLHLLAINCITPFLFYYGRNKKEQKFKDLAIRLLQEIPAEKNSIISKWSQLQMECISAYESQALLHLKKNYCDQKRCTECSIGVQILRA